MLRCDSEGIPKIVQKITYMSYLEEFKLTLLNGKDQYIDSILVNGKQCVSSTWYYSSRDYIKNYDALIHDAETIFLEKIYSGL